MVRNARRYLFAGLFIWQYLTAIPHLSFVLSFFKSHRVRVSSTFYVTDLRQVLVSRVIGN